MDLDQIFSSATPGKPRLVAVYGPTACGKTALAVELARRHGGECINADSRQAYRGLDVATGKATEAEMRGVPHHLLDFVDPGEDVTVGTFAPLARAAIADIHARGKLPILVGGTGLYLEAIIRGFDVPAAPPDASVRQKWEAFAAANGPRALWEELRKRDPAYAAKTEPNNVRFVVRALEVLETTGAKKSEAGAAAESPYDMVLVTPYHEETEMTIPPDKGGQGGFGRPLSGKIIAQPPPSPLSGGGNPKDQLKISAPGGTSTQNPLNPPYSPTGSLRYQGEGKRENPARAALYARIDARTAAMFRDGILKETEIAVAKYGPDAPGLRAIGYAEAAAVLAGKMTPAEAVAQAQQRARNYAKRQLTWFRRWPERYPGKCREGFRVE